MSPILAPAPETTGLDQRIEIIACGERPGKTQACPSHLGKGAALRAIAATGALDALAAAICGTKSARYKSCDDCSTKARRIIGIYNEGAK